MRYEGEQVAEQGTAAGESWNKCQKSSECSVLVGDAGEVWGDRQDW